MKCFKRFLYNLSILLVVFGGVLVVAMGIGFYAYYIQSQGYGAQWFFIPLLTAAAIVGAISITLKEGCNNE